MWAPSPAQPSSWRERGTEGRRDQAQEMLCLALESHPGKMSSYNTRLQPAGFPAPQPSPVQAPLQATPTPAHPRTSPTLTETTERPQPQGGEEVAPLSSTPVGDPARPPGHLARRKPSSKCSCSGRAASATSRAERRAPPQPTQTQGSDTQEGGKSLAGDAPGPHGRDIALLGNAGCLSHKTTALKTGRHSPPP